MSEETLRRERDAAEERLDNALSDVQRLTEALQMAERDLEVLRREYCSQCGQLFLARACGPTHAMIAGERRNREMREMKDLREEK